MENEILAWGYVKDGEILYHFNLPQFAKFTAHAQLGVDLLNFVWFDNDLIEEIFKLLYRRYIYLAEMAASKDAVLDDLLKYMEPLAARNTYLAAYIAETIEYLLSDGNNKDLLTAIAEFMGADYEGLTSSYSLEELKGIVLHKLPEVIAMLQMLLDEELELSIGDASSLKDFTPAQRLFILANAGEHKAGHFDTRFQLSLNSPFDLRDMDEAAIKRAVAEHKIEFSEMYELESIDDMLRFELVQMVLYDCNFKRCRYCGKYFIPSGRSDSEYCSRNMPGETKPCREVGATRIRTAKLQTDPILKAYKKAYSRMDSQKRCGSIKLKEFNDWSWQAIEKRDCCLTGEISLDEFQDWLDLTKKRK